MIGNYPLVSFLAYLFFFAINNSFSKDIGPTILTLSPAFRLYVSYFAGSLVYVFRNQLIFDKKGILFLAFFTLMLIRFGGFGLVSPFLMALLRINIFLLFKVKFKYDISYGRYIYSFPVQQILFQIFGNRLNVYLFILLSLMIAAVMGLLTFKLVERPFLELKKKTDKYFQ